MMSKASNIHKPRYCCWVLNYRCMFRCRACHIWNIKDDVSAETTMEQKKQFVRSLRDMVGRDFEFHLSGGEPLLTDGIIDLVKFIAEAGYRTNLVTNAYLIDEVMAKDIACSGLETLTISLDGMTPRTHDFLRGINGSYERIMRAIDFMDKYRKGRSPGISVLTVIAERNLDEITDLVEWVNQDNRLDMISFQAVTQPFCEERDDLWFQKEKNFCLWPQDIQKTSAIMDRLKDLRLKGYKIGNHPNHFLHFREYFKDPDKFLKKIKCSMGDYEFHIDPYGKVFFCCLTEPFGNVKIDNLPDTWNSRKTQDIRQAVYDCKRNCHIMVNCFYEDEASIS